MIRKIYLLSKPLFFAILGNYFVKKSQISKTQQHLLLFKSHKNSFSNLKNFVIRLDNHSQIVCNGFIFPDILFDRGTYFSKGDNFL